jgi:UDP-N-acetylmuramyl pentapeptide phosphotransferase/UDP-N-acetylglucosamine-1-phosphate transferase
VINLVRMILTAFALLSFSVFAVVSCLRAATFGDRSPPPPPGFYEALSASGVIMFVASIAGMVLLLTFRPRPAYRALLLLAAVVVLICVPFVLARPENPSEAIGVAQMEVTLLSPVIAVALLYLLIAARRSHPR